MNIESSYNLWASQYDTNINKTRDLEGRAFREIIQDLPIENCLEAGCGTGKNTIWLINKVKHVTAVDLSGEMLQKARTKLNNKNVDFIQADISKSWEFAQSSYDLISFSLVLEHIQDLDHIFSEASSFLKAGGYLYLGELHPYKQYEGSKARFDTVEGTQVVDCFTHNISEFISAARKYGLTVSILKEYFDEDDRTNIPRILTILFRKNF